MSMRTESIYTDASVMPHLRSAAYGVFFGNNDKRNFGAPLAWTANIVYCETMAVAMAIMRISTAPIASNTCYKIITDCQGAIYHFKAFFHGMAVRGTLPKNALHQTPVHNSTKVWKTSLYEFWQQEPLSLVIGRVEVLRAHDCSISLEWCKGHSLIHGNEMADKIARGTALRCANQFAHFFNSSKNGPGKVKKLSVKVQKLEVPRKRFLAIETKKMKAAKRLADMLAYRAHKPQRFEGQLPSGLRSLPQIALRTDLPSVPFDVGCARIKELPLEIRQLERAVLEAKENALKLQLSKYPKRIRKHLREDFYYRAQIRHDMLRKNTPRDVVDLTDSPPHDEYESDDDCMTLVVKKTGDPLDASEMRLIHVYDDEPSGHTDYSDDDDCAVILSKASSDILTPEEERLLQNYGCDDEARMKIISQASDRAYAQWKEDNGEEDEHPPADEDELCEYLGTVDTSVDL